MTAREYRRLRERIGTQEEVAKMLKTTAQTISRRERGAVKITREIEYALRHLAAKRAWRL